MCCRCWEGSYWLHILMRSGLKDVSENTLISTDSNCYSRLPGRARGIQVGSGDLPGRPHWSVGPVDGELRAVRGIEQCQFTRAATHDPKLSDDPGCRSAVHRASPSHSWQGAEVKPLP